MENSFVQKLCRIVIGSAFQRCRMSENLCRLSISLSCSTQSQIPSVRISVSDTGVGSCLEEFQLMDCATDRWDGVLCVKTTGICDTEVYDYRLNLKEKVVARRVVRLPPTSKNGGKFSGTEISLSTFENIDGLSAAIIQFLHKMLVLRIQKVAVELMVDRTSITGSRHETLFLANEGIHLPFSLSNIERLVSGLEGYVLKHGNTVDRECQFCFSNREHLKVGTGTAFNSELLSGKEQVIEAVIILAELPEPSNPSCLKACCTKTEDFLPTPISQQLFNAVTSIDWKSYGLSLRSSAIGEDGRPVLEWESLPPYSLVDIAIHCYHKQTVPPQMLQRFHFDRKLLKKAIKLAMDDLKEKYAGSLLSDHAIKIQSYAPDLAKTIAGLVYSSDDINFQGECFGLLGLLPQETGKEKVEDCIREKITAVIGMNDRKPQRNREPAPFLFEDENLQEEDFLYAEDEYDEEYDLMDL